MANHMQALNPLLPVAFLVLDDLDLIQREGSELRRASSYAWLEIDITTDVYNVAYM